MNRCLRIFTGFLIAIVLMTSGLELLAQCGDPMLPLAVVAPNGGMVQGLGSQHLRAKVGNSATAVDSVAPYEGPTRILLLIDQNLVDNNETWPAVHQLANDLVQYARPTTSFALNVYGKGPEIKIPFGGSREEILSKLNDAALMKNHPGKVMDGIIESVEMFDATRPGDVLYVMTDGRDDSSHANAESVRKSILAAGVRVFAIYFRHGRPSSGAGVLVGGKVPFAPQIEPWDPVRNDPIGLAETVEQSGGFYTNVLPAVASDRFELQGAHLQELEKAAAGNYRIMTQFYVVRLKDKPSSGQSVQLELADSKLKGLTLIYPKTISPCKK